jgi:hypothetical protein
MTSILPTLDLFRRLSTMDSYSETSDFDSMSSEAEMVSELEPPNSANSVEPDSSGVHLNTFLTALAAGAAPSIDFRSSDMLPGPVHLAAQLDSFKYRYFADSPTLPLLTRAIYIGRTS